MAEKLIGAGIDVLITKGRIARHFAKHAKKLGMSKRNVHVCRDMAEVLEALDKQASERSIVLVKTSMNDPDSEDLIQKITTLT